MSEYIPRLREQLVAAAAREQAGVRRRPLVLPRVAIAVVIIAALVLAVSAIELPSDEQPVTPGHGTTFQVAPGDAAERSADVLRARLAAVGLDAAKVTVSDDRITVDGVAAGQVDALAVPGVLAVYDWEASVLGRNGQPGLGEPETDPGRTRAVSRYNAVMRAAKARGIGPSTYWVVDDEAREVLDGPRANPQPTVPAGARMVEVPGGVRVVRSHDAGWYALAAKAALGNGQVSKAIGLRDQATGDPIVAIDLNAQGQTAFHAVTRGVAQRAADAALPGDDPLRTSEHIAIVLDDEVESVPFINYQEAPDGIDGRAGVQIQGGLTLDRARELAAVLNSGPMPATLEPVTP
jgi:preprotein translocase subunit SecD